MIENSTIKRQLQVKVKQEVLPASVSASDLVREREALEELVQSEGWQAFRAHVLSEWRGVGYFNRMNAAFEHNYDARVYHMAALEIQRLLDYPATRLTALKGVVDE